MPHTTCAHCGTAITHDETMQQSAGKTYCCRNCLAMASGATSEGTGQPVCAHCESTIVDQSTAVHLGSQSFCCPNCADAVSAGAENRLA
jgi:predicted RNA-binding Zn-ribbon protein involved in translation (DUF1610 family)